MICGFDGAKIDRGLKKTIKDGLGGTILFPRNIGSPKSMLKLSKSLRDAWGESGVIISIDHEGGRVTRLGEPFTKFPPMSEIGKTGDKELARAVGAAMGRELAAVGINLDFSPVVDLAEPDTQKVIGDRSFGTDPQKVATMAAAFVEGMQSEGVAACAKHFPGHGSVAGDSHVELPETDACREDMERHMAPFKHLASSGVASVMTAHIKTRCIDPYHPATISPAIVGGILRDKWNYEGVIITDDLEMAAIADSVGVVDGAFMAVRAGADMLMVAHNTDLAVEVRKKLDLAVRHMLLPIEEITSSFERVSRLKERFPACRPDIPPLDAIGCAEHRKLAASIGKS